MNQHKIEPAGGQEVLFDSAQLVHGQVEVSWKHAASPSQFAPFWLRDHCRAKHSLNADTLPREVDTFSIPPHIAPAKLEIKDGGRTLHVAWAHDESVSLFPA